MDGSSFSEKPGRFAGMADAYLRHRPRWPNEALRLVADRCLPDADARILDLGCGPGTLSEAFGALGYNNYVGVDCEPDMITFARAREPGKNWICAYAEDVELPEQSFDLIVFGRALHWMYRSQVLYHAEQWLRPGGWIVVLNDNPKEPPANPWLYARNEVLDRWNPPPLPLDPSLKKNPFYELECLSDRDLLKLRRVSDVEEIRLPMTRE